MRRRISLSIIFLVVYAVIVVVLDFVLPNFFRGSTYYGGFFPFFFFPFFFGRGLRSGRRNYGNTSNTQKPGEDTVNQNYDAAAWEARNKAQYDEFGIPVRRNSSRTWYIAGMAAILVISVVILVFRGIIGF